MDDKEIVKHISKKVREYRTKKGLSQTGFGKLLGMSKTSISYIENGHYAFMKLSLLYRIAKVLGTEVSKLLP